MDRPSIVLQCPRPRHGVARARARTVGARSMFPTGFVIVRGYDAPPR